eukprot:GDKH01026433.1.p2 GENE.GDKH01026433.1~~GDKH01026433.1.p2  ORF type:complete len:132 (+),score=36.43 GDKH01026433.1:44-439(+)
MVQRLTYRRRCRYATPSNTQKIVRTPGGKLVYQHVKKRGSQPSCRDCGTALAGIPAVRPYEMKHLPKSKRTVSRAYGGNCCPTCVKNRVLRAFLIEEQKCVKQVLQEKKEASRAEQKAASKGSKKSKKSSK